MSEKKKEMKKKKKVTGTKSGDMTFGKALDKILESGSKKKKKKE
jgi:hypothetical protein